MTLYSSGSDPEVCSDSYESQLKEYSDWFTLEAQSAKLNLKFSSVRQALFMPVCPAVCAVVMKLYTRFSECTTALQGCTDTRHLETYSKTAL